MAQQEGGWPLGLQPLNVRVGLVRSFDSYGSISFSTLLSGSPTTSSVASSSDFDTQSTASFLHDGGITLGTLIGVTGILDLPSGSLRGRAPAALGPRPRSASGSMTKTRTWLFSLCARARDVDRNATRRNIAPPSLAHFLEEERRANGGTRRRRRSGSRAGTAAAASAAPIAYELDVLADAHSVDETNTLFLDGRVAPPRMEDGGNKTCRGDAAAGPGVPLRLFCLTVS